MLQHKVADYICYFMEMKWINAIGLTLQFLAFWLAAPELLGESTLLRFKNGLENFLAKLPMIVVMTIILIFALGMSGMGIIKGLKAAKEGISKTEISTFIISLSAVSVLYILFLVFFKRIKNYISEHYSTPLVKKLIQEEKMRKNSLVAGAVLFTLGFLIQIIATLAS